MPTGDSARVDSITWWAASRKRSFGVPKVLYNCQIEGTCSVLSEGQKDKESNIRRYLFMFIQVSVSVSAPAQKAQESRQSCEYQQLWRVCCACWRRVAGKLMTRSHILRKHVLSPFQGFDCSIMTKRFLV